MSELLKYAIIIVVGYLLGSLNFSIIISKLLLKKDVRDYGSGNAGSTNAYRVMGGKKTLLVMLGDFLKGIVAVLIAVAVFSVDNMTGAFPVMLAGFATVLGHAFPLYFNFQGGKGILTSAAVILLFDWRILLIILAVFLIMALWKHYVSLGSILAAAAFPISTAILYPLNLVYLVIAIVWGGGVIFLHRGNIKRLLTHTEKEFSFKRKSEGDAV